jgi:NADH-quinone oxidoreductase subunit K
MSDVYFHITYGHFLVLSAVLFTIGIVGVMLRRNALIVMMSIELMLNAANIAILTFARMHATPIKSMLTREVGGDPTGGNTGLDVLTWDMSGHTLAFVVIAIAAAEAAVGLAIVVAVFRTRRHADIDRLTALKH